MAVESAADLAAFFDNGEFAEAASYTAPGGGAAQSVDVIPDRHRDRVPGDGEMIVRKRRVALARKSQFTTAPAVGGTLVVGGETLKVRAVEDWPDDPTGSIYMLTLAF